MISTYVRQLLTLLTWSNCWNNHGCLNGPAYRLLKPIDIRDFTRCKKVIMFIILLCLLFVIIIWSSDTWRLFLVRNLTYTHLIHTRKLCFVTSCEKGLSHYIIGVYLNLKLTFQKQTKLVLLETLIFLATQNGKEKRKRKSTISF